MGNIKQTNIRNRTYYFYNDMINIKNFDSNLLKLDRKSFKKHCHLLHWTHYKKDKYETNSVNPLYLLVHEIDRFIEEKKGNKYLNIAFTERNSEVLKNMQKLRVKLKIKLKK